MALSSSSSDLVYRACSYLVDHNPLLPGEEKNCGDNGVFAELRFSRAAFNNKVDEESMRINIGLAGVVTREETPVSDLQQALTELDVDATTHPQLIAYLLECIHKEFIEGDACSTSTMVVMKIIEEEVADGLTENEESEDDDDDDIFYQVERARQELMISARE